MARLFCTLVTISKGFHCYVKNSQNKINLVYFSGTTHYNPPSPLSPSTPPPLPLLPSPFLTTQTQHPTKGSGHSQLQKEKFNSRTSLTLNLPLHFLLWSLRTLYETSIKMIQTISNLLWDKLFSLWKYYSQIRVNYSIFNLQEPLSKDQPCALWRMSYSGSFYLHQLKINTMNQILFIITSNYTVQSKSHLKITPTLYRLTFSVVEKSVAFKIAEILAM